MKTYAERFVRSIKSECLDQMIFVGQRSLDRAIREFVEHYNEERSHRGIGNRLVSRAEPHRCGRVRARRRLGGMLNYYLRRAA
jgi:transposase InsO family protein